MSEFEPRFPSPENDPQLPEETLESKEKDKKKSRKKPSFSADYSREDNLERARLDREPQAKKAGETLLGALSKEQETDKAIESPEYTEPERQQVDSTDTVLPESSGEGDTQDTEEVEVELGEHADEEDLEDEFVEPANEVPQTDSSEELKDEDEDESTTTSQPQVVPPITQPITPPTTPNRVPPTPPVPPVIPPQTPASPNVPLPQQPLFNRPVQNPNIQPAPATNQNILTTPDPDAEAYGFRKGRRQGLVVGGLVAWAGTRWNQGRKREKLEKKHKKEVNELKKKVSNLETAKPAAASESTSPERFERANERITPDKEPLIGSYVNPENHNQKPADRANEKPKIVTENSYEGREFVPSKTTSPRAETETKPLLVKEVLSAAERISTTPENATEVVSDRKEVKQEPNDGGGLVGGGAASQPTRANSTESPSIHAVSTLQPITNHVTNVRSQAAKSAKRAQVAARIEIAAAVIMGVVFVAWLFLR